MPYNLVSYTKVYFNEIGLRKQRFCYILPDKMVRSALDMNISVIICSYNRKNQLERCLNGLTKQQQYFFELILIEDITTKQNFSKNKLDQKLPSTRNKYFSVQYKNISQSRQKGLDSISNSSDIVVFIDDDVIINATYFQKLSFLYKTNPNAIGLVGPIQPLAKDPLSIFQAIDYNQQLYRCQTIKKVTLNRFTLTLSLASFKTKLIKKNCIQFDPDLKANEDADFLLKITQFGDIYFSPDLYCDHDFSSSFITFIKKRFFYAKFHGLLQVKHPHLHFIDSYLPKRKLDVYFPPFFIYEYLRFMQHHYKEISNGETLQVRAVIFGQLAEIAGVYSSKHGRKLLIRQVSNIFKRKKINQIAKKSSLKKR